MTRAQARMEPAQLPTGVRLLGAPDLPDEGNLVFRCSAGGGDAILKVYRRRGSFWRERLAQFSQRRIEGKRGVTPARRRATEAAAIALWRSRGFDVPRILERPPPAWAGPHPSLWLELVDGVILRDVLCDLRRPYGARQMLVARLAETAGRRHRCALDACEPLLVQEHFALQHVLVTRDRLVTFDLEHAWRPGFDAATAVACELASTLRALSRCPDAGAPLFDVFADAYGEPAILRETSRLLLGPSLRWRVYRARDQLRRGRLSKTAAMRRVAVRLAGRFEALSDPSRSAGSRSRAHAPDRCG